MKNSLNNTVIKTIRLEDFNPASVSAHGVVRLSSEKKYTPEEFLEIASRLGKPQSFGLSKYRPSRYPPEVTVLDNRGDGITAAPGTFGEGWHQDSTFLSDAPAYTVLHAWDVPADGGDTLFADTREILQTYCEETRKKLSALSLVHSVRSTYRVATKDVGLTLDEIMQGLPKSQHPLVFQHPRGDTTLMISPLYTQGGLSANDRELVDQLLEKIVSRQLVYKWKAGDIIAWDNRVVLHAATGYAGDERRRLIRTVVQDVLGDIK